MKERLEQKIDEVIENILSKDAKDVTYNDYRILDNKLASIRYAEEQKTRNEEMVTLMAKAMGSTLSLPPSHGLTEEKED